jgi:ECF sigma factor
VHETTPKSVTQLLMESSQGNQEAFAVLMPPVYEELHRLARSYMRRERPGHTLQTTGLAHEASPGSSSNVSKGIKVLQV